MHEHTPNNWKWAARIIVWNKHRHSKHSEALGKKGTPTPEFTIQTEYRGHYEPEHHGPMLGKWLGKLGRSGPFFSQPGCAEQTAASLSIGNTAMRWEAELPGRQGWIKAGLHLLLREDPIWSYDNSSYLSWSSTGSRWGSAHSREILYFTKNKHWACIALHCPTFLRMHVMPCVLWPLLQGRVGPNGETKWRTGDESWKSQGKKKTHPESNWLCSKYI